MGRKKGLDYFRFILLPALFFCAFFCRAPAEAVRISVLEPSELELVMASGRDFYVIGRIDREGRRAAELPIDIRVEVAVTGLVRAGEKIPVRSVRSHVDRTTGVTPERDIYFDYDGKAPWSDIPREELMKSPPPDLVYRHGDAGSFFDPSVKAAVTEDTFAVLVQGGATKDFDTGYENVYSGDLEWKLFRVFVDALSGDEVLDSREMDIMFGTVQDKLLTRFSPPEHLAAAVEFAAPPGIRVYKDLFPGYWSFGLSSVYEIPLRWKPNNALEFLEGRVHAIIYNITENCVSQRVELGHIAFQGWLDSDEVHFYGYDIGEPWLTYEKWGETLRRKGVITRFEHGQRLRLTRAEIARDPASRGENAGRAELFPFAAVIANPGETVSVCGIVTPIQPKLSEVVPEEDGSFTIQNRIRDIHYQFNDILRGVTHEAEHEVGLARRFGGRTDVSIYEFRHTLSIPETLRGRVLTVTVSARDSHGEPVEGAEAVFYLYPRDNDPPAP